MGSKQRHRQAPSKTAARSTAVLVPPCPLQPPSLQGSTVTAPPPQPSRLPKALGKPCIRAAACEGCAQTPPTRRHAHTYTHNTAARAPVPGHPEHQTWPLGSVPIPRCRPEPPRSVRPAAPSASPLATRDGEPPAPGRQSPALEAVQAAAARTAAAAGAARGQCRYGGAGSGQRESRPLLPATPSCSTCNLCNLHRPLSRAASKGKSHVSAAKPGVEALRWVPPQLPPPETPCDPAASAPACIHGLTASGCCRYPLSGGTAVGCLPAGVQQARSRPALPDSLQSSARSLGWQQGPHNS